MESSNKIKFANIAIRAATLASRFALVFFLARFIGAAELGLYGLFVATVGYSLYLLGFDFYTYITREILKIDCQYWGGALKNQITLSLILYAIFLPCLSLLFVFDMLPMQLAGWFFILLILEHINQELHRLLAAISRQLLASTVLFLRQGVWAIAIVVAMTYDPGTRTLNHIFAAWTLAATLSALLAMRQLRLMGISGWHENINWQWILRGLKVAIPLLISTLALRGIFTLDRYWINEIGDLQMVGSYVLYAGISSTLLTALDASVFSFSYPSLIKAFQNNLHSDYIRKLKSLTNQTFVLSALFSVFSILTLPFLLQWINNPVYTHYQYLYPWLLASAVVYALGMIPHYALYAQGMDRPIIFSHISGLLVFIPATWLASLKWATLAVPIGLIVAFTLILVWKALALRLILSKTPIQSTG